MLPVAGPVVTSSGVVSVSPWLTDRRPVCWGETGRLLSEFHAAHAAADVPDWEPLASSLAISRTPVFADLGRLHFASPMLPLAL